MVNRFFCLDMDCFFVSVEISLNPSLKGKPVVVGGRNGHGVVSSASYEARALGIKSAMPIITALKIYKQLIITDHHMDMYVKISNQIHNLLSSVIKNIEQGSIDEWYIDVSNSQYESWTEQEFGDYLKSLIKTKFNMNCSVGCSYNKFFSKMATTLSKPNGFLIIDKNNFKEKLYDLDVDKMTFVGKKTADILKQHNINKIKDIVGYKNDHLMHKLLGVSWFKIKANALGVDNSLVDSNSRRKMVGKSYTIDQFNEFSEFELLIKRMVKEIQNTIRNTYSFKSFTLRCKVKDSINLVKTIRYESDKKVLNYKDVIFALDEVLEPRLYSRISNVSLSVNNIESISEDVDQLSLFDQQTKETDIEKIKNKVNSTFQRKILFTFKN